METIDWSIFNKKIKINTSLEKVYKHWTTPELLCILFLKEAVYNNQNRIVKGPNEQLKTNDSYAWKWHNYDGEEKGIVKEANGRDTIVFTFAGESNVKVFLEEKGYEVKISAEAPPEYLAHLADCKKEDYGVARDLQTCILYAMKRK